jgi:hypothetical protein
LETSEALNDIPCLLFGLFVKAFGFNAPPFHDPTWELVGGEWLSFAKETKHHDVFQKLT